MFYRSGCKGLLFTYEGKKYASDFQLFVITVKERLRHLRPQERKGAELALLYKQRLNFPTSRVLKQMLTAGTFLDTAITTRDIDNCDYVYGKGYAEAAGKMVFKPTQNDEPNELIEEAMHFVAGLKDKEITLHSDIMIIDGLPFLISVSEWINYTTITYLGTRTWAKVLLAIECQKNLWVQCETYKIRSREECRSN